MSANSLLYSAGCWNSRCTCTKHFVCDLSDVYSNASLRWRTHHHLVAAVLQIAGAEERMPMFPIDSNAGEVDKGLHVYLMVGWLPAKLAQARSNLEKSLQQHCQAAETKTDCQ